MTHSPASLTGMVYNDSLYSVNALSAFNIGDSSPHHIKTDAFVEVNVLGYGAVNLKHNSQSDKKRICFTWFK